MVRKLSEIKKIANDTIYILKKHIEVDAAYIFGSYIEGRPDTFSDIDIAVFSPSLNNLDLEKKINIIVETEKEINKEIELHLFKSEYVKEARPTNIFGHIINHGLKIF